MAVPRTRISVEFEIGGVNLHHYYAQDSHGSYCETYKADGHIVSREEFLRIIKESLQGAESYVASALGMIKVGK